RMSSHTDRRSSHPPPRPRGVPVLLIDDSDVDREVMKDLLQRGGFHVYDTPSPIGATRRARELQVRAVVIDQNLPSLDGNKLAALFRSTAALQEVRVVLVSSSDDTGMLEITRQAKADAFVNKLRLHEELVPTLRRVLGKS
ncbi:MAG: response regulator, partial [Polyangiales bacterium]